MLVAKFSLRCAYCYLLEVSPVSLAVLAIRLALFFIVTHTHTTFAACPARCRRFVLIKIIILVVLVPWTNGSHVVCPFCLFILIRKRVSWQRPRSAMLWKTLEKSGLEPTAPNCLAYRKHWGLSTQPHHGMALLGLCLETLFRCTILSYPGQPPPLIFLFYFYYF